MVEALNKMPPAGLFVASTVRSDVYFLPRRETHRRDQEYLVKKAPLVLFLPATRDLNDNNKKLLPSWSGFLHHFHYIYIVLKCFSEEYRPNMKTARRRFSL